MFDHDLNWFIFVTRYQFGGIYFITETVSLLPLVKWKKLSVQISYKSDSEDNVAAWKFALKFCHSVSSFPIYAVIINVYVYHQ